MPTSKPTSPRADLISPEYLAEQKKLHERDYGGGGAKWADTVHQLAIQGGHRSILDYGAGQGTLGLALRVMGHQVADYDPARKEFAAMPYPADLVTCTDALEHIEPEKIDAVLGHLRQLTGRLLFVVISLVPASKKTLSDGRNAHILLRSEDWWTEAFTAHQFEFVGLPYNPSPHKQIVQTWRPAR